MGIWQRAKKHLQQQLTTLRLRLHHRLETRKTVRHNGVSLILLIDNWIEYYRWESFATKEPETLRYLEAYVEPGDTFYDIGANVGLYSLYCARIHPHARIVAFEPEAENYRRLNQHIWENRLADIIRSYPLCVSNQNTPSTIYLRERLTGSALHSEGDTIDQDGNVFASSYQQGTYCTTLDSFVALGGPFPNHIKVDVDGNEHKVFEGMRGLLADPRLRTVCVELVPKGKTSPEEIKQAMSAYGFRIDTSLQQINPSGNTVFLRDQSPTDLWSDRR